MELGFHYLFIECNICHALLAWRHGLPAVLSVRSFHLRGAIVALLDVRQVRRRQPGQGRVGAVELMAAG
jgi:hypothetical protein